MTETLYQIGIRMRQETYAKVEELLALRFSAGQFDTEFLIYGPAVPRFTSLNDSVWSEWERHWKNHPWRRHQWDWRDFHREYVNSPSRLEAALWCDGMLCGLAIGGLSRGREHLSVKLLEGSPDRHHPLKGRVRHCLLPLAEAYARSHLCKRIYLLDPLEPVIPLYEQMGYHLMVKSGTEVCCKEF